jgi:putative intracellular protease/amidase
MNTIQSILVLAYPNAGEQDLLIPWELLKAVAWDMAGRGHPIEVVLGSFEGSSEGGTVPTQMGTRVQTEKTISPSDRFDLVYVPGGIGAGVQSLNETLLEFLRAHRAEGRWIAGNCAGMAVLHRAGVLEGLEVTSPATLSRKLPAEGTRVIQPRRAWKIDPQNRVFSSGGAGTVNASTMALVWHLFGDEAGRALAAGWDASPLHGEALFSLLGPVMNDDPVVASGLQDAWEDIFLPAPLTTSASCEEA